MAVKRYDPKIVFAPGSSEPVRDQLLRLFRQSFWRDGQAHAGQSLVSERSLSASLGIDRSAIHAVLEELSATGYLEKSASGRRYLLRNKSDLCFGKSIGIVLPFAFSKFINSNQYNHLRIQLYCGITERASSLGLGTILIELPDAKETLQAMDDFLSSRLPHLAGLIHFGSRGFASDPILGRCLEQRSLPQIMLLSEAPQYSHVGTVTFDARGTMMAVAQFLLSSGQKKLGVVFHEATFSKEVKATMANLQECVEMLRESGMIINEDWIIRLEGTGCCNGLPEKMKKFLALEEKPDAIWCRNDFQALETIQLLQEGGLRVPQDISVIGTDDIFESKNAGSTLTTLQLPRYSLGVAAVDMLIEQIQNGVTPENKVKIFSPSLIVRQTTRG